MAATPQAVFELSPGLMHIRYDQLQPLGHGGMGVVFRAYDRLRKDYVALKKVRPMRHAALLESMTMLAQHSKQLTLQLDQPVATLEVTISDKRMALANEFRTLASLRHPNIISVLDYGFEGAHASYFTMELLTDARTIFEVGKDADYAEKIGLLVQLLQALAYLHRRGILHRDLKPANVLVVGGQVKVLDFGLSAATGVVSDDISGTLAYMAPELLQNAPSTAASDFYAVGVMAYELFTLKHPFGFKGGNASEFIMRVLTSSVDVDVPGIPAPLKPILRRLIARDPALRYTSADDIIMDLNDTLDSPLPTETEAIRESFLQAAPLVGRQAELRQLSDVLVRTCAGHGGAWLIGGESGVGKSRLVNEIRTEALVKGMLVVSGQAVDGGAALYEMWRSVVPLLALGAPLSELDVSVLSAIAPDLPSLLNVVAGELPELPPQAARTRLFAIVTELLRSQRTPLLVILEDVQWADDSSLSLLNWIIDRIDNYPILLLGTYRDDEKPALPQLVPEASYLKLARLTADEIRILSRAMLGSVGEDATMLAWFQQETEGNVFFLIEVVRALAEASGQLAEVGHIEPPQHVFAGGIQRIIRRRLEHIPADTWDLLRLAAVAGRELDPRLLTVSFPTVNVDTWLTQAADACVLEVQDDHWRFAHDKLREGVLATCAPEHIAALHAEVGYAIERAYAADLSDKYPELAYHFGKSGDTDRQQQYALFAGIQAAERFDHSRALDYLSHALSLTPPDDYLTRYMILITREAVLDPLGRRQQQLEDLQALDQVVEQLADMPLARTYQFDVRLRRANYHVTVGEYHQGVVDARAALELAEAIGSLPRQAQAHSVWGRALWRLSALIEAQGHFATTYAVCQEIGLEDSLVTESLRGLGNVELDQGNYASALQFYEQSRSVGERIGDLLAQARALNNLGEVYRLTGDFAAALRHYEAAGALAREIGERSSESLVYTNLALVARYTGHYANAMVHAEHAEQMCRDLSEPYGLGWALLGKGYVYDELGDYEAAQTAFHDVEQLARDTGHLDGEGWALAGLALAECHAGLYDNALKTAEHALKVADDINNRSIKGRALHAIAHAMVGLRRVHEAAATFQQAADLRRAINEQVLAIESLGGLVQTLLFMGDQTGLRAVVDDIVTFLDNTPPSGMDEPFRLILTCVQALEALEDPRARSVLQAGCQRLQMCLDLLVGTALENTITAYGQVQHALLARCSA